MRHVQSTRPSARFPDDSAHALGLGVVIGHHRVDLRLVGGDEGGLLIPGGLVQKTRPARGLPALGDGSGHRDLIGAGLAGQLEIEPRLEGLGHLAADLGRPGLLGQVRDPLRGHTGAPLRRGLLELRGGGVHREPVELGLNGDVPAPAHRHLGRRPRPGQFQLDLVLTGVQLILERLRLIVE